jgi:hypothetical protein
MRWCCGLSTDRCRKASVAATRVLQFQAVALWCALLSSVNVSVTGTACDGVKMTEDIFGLSLVGVLEAQLRGTARLRQGECIHAFVAGHE